MSTTKISAPDGKYSLIADRSSTLATEHAAIIKSVSSTEAQPWVAVNFTADGIAAGGRTMTQYHLEITIVKAKKAGLKVEEI